MYDGLPWAAAAAAAEALGCLGQQQLRHKARTHRPLPQGTSPTAADAQPGSDTSSPAAAAEDDSTAGDGTTSQVPA